MNYWFSSDYHLNHRGIVVHCHRPFKDVEEMNETIITNHNAVVQDKDEFYFLGDLCFGNEKVIAQFLGRLRGKIKIIFGNHDKTLKKFARKDLNAHSNLKGRVEFLGDFKEINILGQKITLCHYPLLTWNRKAYGSWMLAAHSHYNMPATRKEGVSLGKILDVGVDGNSFKPYSFEEIKRIMENKPLFSKEDIFNDHHVPKELDKQK